MSMDRRRFLDLGAAAVTDTLLAGGSRTPTPHAALHLYTRPDLRHDTRASCEQL